MRRATLLLTVVGAVLLAFSGVLLAQQEERSTQPAASQGTTPPKTPTEKIPDHYIVVLKDDGSGQDPGQVASARARRGGQDPTQVANEQAQRHGLEVRDVYQNTIKGYAAVIPEGELEEVENDPRVAFVEQDQKMQVTKKKKKEGTPPAKPFLGVSIRSTKT